MGQQYSSTALRALWCEWEGRGSEFSGCPPAGRWAFPTFMDRQIGGVPAVAEQAFAALEVALWGAGYRPPGRAQSVWAYNKRPIAGTSVLSLHSYGIAIDIDPTANPHAAGDPYSGWMKKSHVDAVMAIRTRGGRRLFYWGGYWSLPDRMHYQLDTVPADCQPDWSTVPGHEEDEMTEEDWAKLRTIVREEIDKEFTERLKMDEAQTNAISRGVWQHKGQTSQGVNHEKSTSTLLRGTYNAVTE